MSRKSFLASSVNPKIIVSFFFVILAMAGGGCRTTQPERSAIETDQITLAPTAVNINTASVEELESIPHVGRSLALKIIEYRETNGPFRRPEYLILIQGISDKRFRKIRHLIRVE
ncbi:MAG: ComEA family DNA-binding protein [Blastocatellia bacterium]